MRCRCPSRFAAAKTGASIVTRGPSTVAYKLSEPALVRFRVQRAGKGRRVGGRCLQRTPSRRRAKPCIRYRTLLGSFTHRGKRGANRFKFSGRLNSRSLPTGRYRLRAITDAAANTSTPKHSAFVIRRR